MAPDQGDISGGLEPVDSRPPAGSNSAPDPSAPITDQGDIGECSSAGRSFCDRGFVYLWRMRWNSRPISSNPSLISQQQTLSLGRKQASNRTVTNHSSGQSDRKTCHPSHLGASVMAIWAAESRLPGRRVASRSDAFNVHSLSPRSMVWRNPEFTGHAQRLDAGGTASSASF